MGGAYISYVRSIYEGFAENISAMKTSISSRYGIALSLTALIGFSSFTWGTEAADWTRDDAAHLLRRAGLGGTPR